MKIDTSLQEDPRKVHRDILSSQNLTMESDLLALAVA